MDEHDWDAVVVGGGTAGLSAAQMLGRARRRTLVLDAGAPRNRFADHMHGVLGHDGALPLDLLARGRAEVEHYGVEARSARVTRIRETGDGLVVTLDDGSQHRTRTAVIAAGLRDELPQIPGLDSYWGRSVLHCPYCHGWEVAGQRLGVLATTPASTHQMELIRQWSADLTVFTADIEPLDPVLSDRLAARGIRVVADPVRELIGDAPDLRGVVTADGSEYPIDALFVVPAPHLELGFTDELELARADTPGSPLAVDAFGKTSHPRIWAAGNVVAPFANVPVSMGAGSMAGAAVNAALVMEDADAAVARARREARGAAWEARYADTQRSWSGRVNTTLADVVDGLPRGTALDIGSGEGGDALWLAERGWHVTGTDVSPTAVARSVSAAWERGLGLDRIAFIAADAELDLPAGPFDLVTASFLHSWEADFPRFEILRAAAARVAPRGHLLVVSHAAPPSWIETLPAGAPPLLTPHAELALLALDDREWTPLLVEMRKRPTTTPEGSPGAHTDGVLLLQRR